MIATAKVKIRQIFLIYKINWNPGLKRAHISCIVDKVSYDFSILFSFSKGQMIGISYFGKHLQKLQMTES